MSRRIREAMKDDTIGNFGAGGGTVEVSETFIGRDPDVAPLRHPYCHLNKVVALVNRAISRSASVVFAGDFSEDSVEQIVAEYVSPEAHLMTDEARYYRNIGRE